MKRTRALPWWPALLVAALGLLALYAGALSTGFLADDYTLFEAARTSPFPASLASPGPPGGFYRPLSRQIWFGALTPLAGGAPAVFHAASAALFLAAVALVLELLLALAPLPAAMAGALYFALLPLQRVNLTWASCAQDLLALVAALGALALHRRGATRGAALLCVAAFASKEAALPLPLALFAWDRIIARRSARESLARIAPSALALVLWSCLLLVLRALSPAGSASLRFAPGQFLAGYAHQIQSLLGLEHPAGLLRALVARGPNPVALALIGSLALWLRGRSGAAQPAAPPAAPVAAAARAVAIAPAAAAPRPAAIAPAATAARAAAAPATVAPRAAVAFAIVWLAAFGFVTGPVAHLWSSYYYTLSAVGGAVLVAALARGIEPWSWLALGAGLLWWHAGATGSRGFAVAERPWVWASHVTSFSLQRGGSLSDTLSRRLTALEPSPAHGTRFFFATLPPATGFQSGSGARVRALYRDPTLGSHFYSEFSESTAADHPVRILYWDGAGLRPLYDRQPDPFFQVGTDLLLLGRPAGAAHAFRRGLDAGGSRLDLLYWLGWAELERGNRRAAEAAWQAWGASDDSLEWFRQLRMAQTALAERRDTLLTRRLLLGAIRAGIGQPEAHAVLGQLLMREHPKYGALETQVAVRLKPGDWLARRELVLALAAARLDDRAREQLEALDRLYPGAHADPKVAEVRRALERRAGSGVLGF